MTPLYPETLKYPVLPIVTFPALTALEKLPPAVNFPFTVTVESTPPDVPMLMPMPETSTSAPLATLIFVACPLFIPYCTVNLPFPENSTFAAYSSANDMFCTVLSPFVTTLTLSRSGSVIVPSTIALFNVSVLAALSQ